MVCCRNGFFVEATRLKSEREARRIIDPFKSRTWKIASSSTLNRMKTHTSYKLVPYGNSLPHALPGAAYLRRAGFLKRHLWVTRYNPEEIFPGVFLCFRVTDCSSEPVPTSVCRLIVGGWFPNQNPKSDGLPVWTRRDGNVEDTDVVVWYTFVLDHVPRLEDWPMVTMHVEKVGFCLVPNGFFNSTPAIDLPRQSLVQPSAGKGYSHTGPDGSYTLTGAPGSSLPNNVAGCASCPTGAAVPAPLPSKL
jgi:primary-amine oxidase